MSKHDKKSMGVHFIINTPLPPESLSIVYQKLGKTGSGYYRGLGRLSRQPPDYSHTAVIIEVTVLFGVQSFRRFSGVRAPERRGAACGVENVGSRGF